MIKLRSACGNWEYTSQFKKSIQSTICVAMSHSDTLVEVAVRHVMYMTTA